jgi:hypothetical protein
MKLGAEYEVPIQFLSDLKKAGHIRWIDRRGMQAVSPCSFSALLTDAASAKQLKLQQGD